MLFMHPDLFARFQSSCIMFHPVTSLHHMVEQQLVLLFVASEDKSEISEEIWTSLFPLTVLAVWSARLKAYLQVCGGG